MQIILFFMTFFLAIGLTPAPVLAQDLSLGLGLGETAEEQATQRSQKFFSDCVKKPIFNLTETTDQAFCACGAASLQAWLEKPAPRTGDIYQAPVKELDKLTLLSEVYAPCLYIPVYEMSLQACVTDDNQAYFMKTDDELDDLCHCMASGDEAYFRDFAAPYLQMKVADGKDFDDPIREVKKSTDFYKAHFTTQTNCHQDIKRARRK